MWIGRGIKYRQPDDLRGMIKPKQKLRGRDWKRGKFATHRDDNTSRTEQSASSTAKKLVMVPMEPPTALNEHPQDHGRVRIGKIFSWIAVSSVGLLWLNGLMLILSGLLFQKAGWWGEMLGPVAGGVFVLVHLTGFAAEACVQGKHSWGMRAIVAFWISILAWVPLGVMLSLLSELFS